MDEKLSRREREIIDILLMLHEATAEDVRVRLTDPPSYSTARAILSRLETKGLVRHREKGLRYVYAPVISHAKARRSAVDRLVRVFYEGSLGKAVTGLVDSRKLSDRELDAIQAAIETARKDRRKK